MPPLFDIVPFNISNKAYKLKSTAKFLENYLDIPCFFHLTDFEIDITKPTFSSSSLDCRGISGSDLKARVPCEKGKS